MNRPKPTWLIEGVLPKGLTCLYSKENVGKSFTALDFGLCMVTGRPWLGRAVEQGLVAYICGEGADGFSERMRSWASRFGTSADGQLQEGFRVVPLAVDMRSSQDVRRLRRSIAAWTRKPKLIVIDTLARCFGSGDENSGKDMGTFIGNCDSLRAGFPDCSVLILHHPGKDEAKGPRGHSSLAGALECSMYLKRPDAKQHAHIDLYCHKMKDGSPFERQQLALVKEGESLVVAKRTILQAGTTAPKRKAKGLSENANTVLLVLRKATGPLSWKTLIAQAGLAPSSLTHSLRSLEERGVATKRENGLWEAVPSNANANVGLPTPTRNPGTNANATPTTP